MYNYIGEKCKFAKNNILTDVQDLSVTSWYFCHLLQLESAKRSRKDAETKDLEDKTLSVIVPGDKSNAELAGLFFFRKTRYDYHPDVSSHTFETRMGLVYRI